MLRLSDLLDRLRPVLVVVPTAGLIAGFLARFAGLPDWAPIIWTIGTVPVIAALATEIATSLMRREVGLETRRGRDPANRSDRRRQGVRARRGGVMRTWR